MSPAFCFLLFFFQHKEHLAGFKVQGAALYVCSALDMLVGLLRPPIKFALSTYDLYIQSTVIHFAMRPVSNTHNFHTGRNFIKARESQGCTYMHDAFRFDRSIAPGAGNTAEVCQILLPICHLEPYSEYCATTTTHDKRR